RKAEGSPHGAGPGGEPRMNLGGAAAVSAVRTGGALSPWRCEHAAVHAPGHFAADTSTHTYGPAADSRAADLDRAGGWGAVRRRAGPAGGGPSRRRRAG